MSMKKICSIGLAAITAFTCTSASFAADTSAFTPSSNAVPEQETLTASQTSNKDVEAALRKVKSRISVPTELTEFNYHTSKNISKTVYNFYWNTPNSAEKYREMSCSICSNVITSYSSYQYTENTETALAQLSEDELYSYAAKAIKKLNPSVYKNIEIEKDNLSIDLRGRNATFSIVRTKNGVPVNNDRGKIVLDKNTGELISFRIQWHTNASFQSPAKAISESKAMDCYENMIELYPMYNINYNWEDDKYTTEIVYTQKNYGEINAFTGKKSNFTSDGYWDEEFAENETTDAEAGGIDNGSIFTEQELAELNKELPYGTEAKAREILESKDYFVIDDEMTIQYSNLYKQTKGKTDRYFYGATFSNVDKDKENWWNSAYEEVSITLDAETAEIISYYYYNSRAKNYSPTYDEAAANNTAEAILKDLAGEKLGEYGETTASPNVYYDEKNNNKIQYYGSNYNLSRYANDIIVSGNDIFLQLDCDNILTGYEINYTDVDFISPENMLTADEIMDIYWENNDINLYYLAKTHEKKTKTVLVYGTENTIYCDAFTGEQKYYSYFNNTNDFNKIETASIKEMAEILNNHSIILSSNAFSETDTVTELDFYNALNKFTEVRLYGTSGKLQLADGRIFTASDIEITNADAMIMLTAAECGTKVAELDNIFKSPYSDIKDSDDKVGYYAIAYELINSDANKLNPDEAFTYADMIELIYNYLA